MSLKEILSQRNDCPICQTILTVVSVDLPGVTVKHSESDIHVWLNKKPSFSITFNVDNTYKKTKQWKMEWVTPLSLSRRCPICGPVVVVKGRAAGYSTQADYHILNGYEIKFDLYGPGSDEDQSIFRTDPLEESLMFTQNKTRYVIKNDLKTKNAIIKISNIDGILPAQTIKTPLITFSNIESFNELIRKIKIYQLFS